MSLDAMLAVFKLPADACTSSERLLLLAMAESASETGELSAYARSQDFMAFKCGWLRIDGVRRLQRGLERKGLLKCHRQGSGIEPASYMLTFIETVPVGSLSKVWKQRRRENHPPQMEGAVPHICGGSDPSNVPPICGGLIDPLNNHPLEHVGARGISLRDWFDHQLWPCFPEKVDKRNAWRVMTDLAPSTELREQIIAGLQRSLARRDAIALEADDGFVERLPTPTNWILGRRWEDE